MTKEILEKINKKLDIIIKRLNLIDREFKKLKDTIRYKKLVEF